MECKAILLTEMKKSECQTGVVINNKGEAKCRIVSCNFKERRQECIKMRVCTDQEEINGRFFFDVQIVTTTTITTNLLFYYREDNIRTVFNMFLKALS